MSEIRGTMVLDWDGICEDSYGQGNGQPYDFRGIDMAHERGYAVAVSTCNNVEPIAEVLIKHGYVVSAKPVHRTCYWYDPAVILVTNVKISGWYVDDRAVMRGTASPTWQFPVNWREVFAQVDAAEAHPERYEPAW